MRDDSWVDEAIRSWLEEDAPAHLPTRVLDATFARTRASAQRSSGRAALLGRSLPGFIPVLGGVVVVLLLALVTLNGFPRATPGTPSTSPTISGDGSLPLGSFRLWDPQRDGPEVSVIIPAGGWHGTPGDGLLIKNSNPIAPDALGVLVHAESPATPSGAGHLLIYPDSCRWATGNPPEPVTTMDEAVNAFARQGSREAGAPVAITVDGHAGMAITLRVRAGIEAPACDDGEFRALVDGDGGVRNFTASDTIDELWIVDAGDGAGLLIFDLVYDDAIPATLIEELRSMIRSATFE